MPTPINTPPIYQNPFMAKNDFSGIHLNAYMTDTGSVKGPASVPNQSLQQKFMAPPGIAATMAFTASGQLITIRIGSPDMAEGAPTILLIDPTTLITLYKVLLPQRKKNPSGKISFAGGYFYLDQKSNVVCVTADQQIRTYSTSNNQLIQLQDQTYDLKSSINDSDDAVNSVLPDSYGNIWYITQGGVVGYIDIYTGKPSLVVQVETISKSFASDGNGGVYIVTDSPDPGVATEGSLYRYTRGAQGPITVWRAPYNCGLVEKPGQNQVGCGTTPTCFDDFAGNRFVAIADNAPQMNVNVYSRETGKLVAQQPVFTETSGACACENSLIAVNRSILIENNWGNSNIDSTAGPLTTKPGVARIDFDPATGQSKVVWTNTKTAVPSVVSQLSTGDGIFYTYAKDTKGWYWAALDFANGNLVKPPAYVQKFTDPGAVEEANNNWYAGLTVGPTGAAYLSVFGGLTVWRPA
jgi:hypothetical protein